MYPFLVQLQNVSSNQYVQHALNTQNVHACLHGHATLTRGPIMPFSPFLPSAPAGPTGPTSPYDPATVTWTWHLCVYLVDLDFVNPHQVVVSFIFHSKMSTKLSFLKHQQQQGDVSEFIDTREYILECKHDSHMGIEQLINIVLNMEVILSVTLLLQICQITCVILL